jgi:3-phenylpropionate/trans-cinnamate dioxygenase ferredoxin reductase subunit
VAFYADQAIALRLSTSVVAIDRAARRLRLHDGSLLAYDHLILATGARARRLTLAGADLPGVLELRSAADADRLKAALAPRPGWPERHLVVIGGGYIGLEVAASARALGARATVLEREDRVLARVASPALSAFFQDLHRAHGVSLELACRIAALEAGADGRVGLVRLSDGRALACDAVLAGVGAVAEDDLAREAGLACDGGVVVDLAARTADPAIFAIGDCTRRPLPHYDCHWRLESVPNALEQAKQAAAALCGRAPPVPEVPWFWSDQYDVRLQIAGLPIEASRIVLRGDPGAGSFALFHLAEDGRLLAVEAVNAAPDFMAGKMMIARRHRLRAERIADASIPLKELAA